MGRCRLYSTLRAMSSNIGGVTPLPVEFDWAKAKNGAVKAVFALVYVKSAVGGVVSALVYGKWGGARAQWGSKTRV